MRYLYAAVSLLAVPAFLASADLAQAKQEQVSASTTTATSANSPKVKTQPQTTQQVKTTTKVSEVYIDLLDNPDYAQAEKAVSGSKKDFLARAEKSLEMLEGKIKVMESDINDGPSSSKDKSGENRAEYLVEKKEAIDKRIHDLRVEPLEVWSWEKEMEVRNSIRELRSEYQQTASAHTGEKYIDQDRPEQIQVEATAGPSTLEPKDPIVTDAVPKEKVKVQTETTTTQTNTTPVKK